MNKDMTVCVNLNRKEFLDMLELLQDVIGSNTIDRTTGESRVTSVLQAKFLLNKVRQSFFGINDSE